MQATPLILGPRLPAPGLKQYSRLVVITHHRTCTLLLHTWRTIPRSILRVVHPWPDFGSK